MKKQFTKVVFLGLAVAAMGLASCTKEEAKKENNGGSTSSLAPTTAMNRVAVLEDFTGVRCGYCPDGHVKAKAVADANPGKFIIIAVHGGSYATPAAGWMNFTTPQASGLISQAKVTGYPAGTISRKVAADLGVSPQSAGGMAMSRGSWAAAAASVMAMPAPVNLGAKATYDAGTKMLKVQVDLYYTGDESSVVNNLNVALVQDKLMSKQSGDPTPSDPYEQNHVLRQFLTTGTYGENISEARTVGSKVSKTYELLLPDFYNGSDPVTGGGAVVINDLKVVAFVTRGQVDITNAIEVDVQ